MQLLWTLLFFHITFAVTYGGIVKLLKKRVRRNYDDLQLAEMYWKSPVWMGVYINNDYADSAGANTNFNKRTDTPLHPSTGSGSGSYFFSDEKRDEVPEKPKQVNKTQNKVSQIQLEKESELTAEATKVEVQGEEQKEKEHSTITCEGQKDWLQCPMYQLIKVRNAFWGRDNEVSCSRAAIEHGLKADKMCAQDESNTMVKVQNSCDGENACELIASPVYFDRTDCPDVYKYLRVNWECAHSESRTKDDKDFEEKSITPQKQDGGENVEKSTATETEGIHLSGTL